MSEAIFVIIVFYCLITGLIGPSIILARQSLFISDNKVVAYFIIGLLFGWIIVPIKAIKGIEEIIKERINQ